MKLIATFTLFALLSCVSASNQSRPKDVLGWEGSRWGMTAEDIAKEFGLRAEKLPSSELYGEWYYEQTVSGVPLKGETYTAIFVMEKSTEKLVGVDLRLDQYESPTVREDVFNNLESLLIEQYGPPDGKKDDRVPETIALSRTWKFPTTSIDLFCSWHEYGHGSNVMISYRQTEAKPATATTHNNASDRRAEQRTH